MKTSVCCLSGEKPDPQTSIHASNEIGNKVFPNIHVKVGPFVTRYVLVFIETVTPWRRNKDFMMSQLPTDLMTGPTCHQSLRSVSNSGWMDGTSL